MSNRMTAFVLAAAGMMLASSAALAAITVTYDDSFGSGKAGQVNISGATLFQSFFENKVSTHDDSDVDGDGLTGYNPSNPPGSRVDQLAVLPDDSTLTTFWAVQYRGIGSGNGLGEFVDYQLSAGHTGVIPAGNEPGDVTAPSVAGRPYPLIPWSYSSDFSLLNRFEYATGGTPVDVSSIGGIDLTFDPNQGSATGTPLQQETVDLAVMDVPTTWFVRVGPDDAGAWDANPTDPGYGYSLIYDKGRGKYDSLKSNVRTLPSDPADPASALVEVELPLAQVTDNPIAWVPIAFLQNRGVDAADMSVTELQHLFLTGRMPTGENLNAATRDSGSGTRNGAMNCIGVDPAWGRGDARDPKHKTKPEGYLGDTHMWTNKNSSSRMEDTVQNNRLAVGYTGLMDSSKAADHFYEGKLEVVNIIFDDRGGSTPVRPSVENCIINGDPDTGYQIGGPETFAEGPQTSVAAQAYIDNILASIDNFSGSPSSDPNFLTPAESLAQSFILLGALDYEPNPVDPTDFVPNGDNLPGQNAALKSWQLSNTVLTPDGSTVAGYDANELAPYGAVEPTGIVPQRNPKAVGVYSDGVATANYVDAWGGVWVKQDSLPSNSTVTGDFNMDSDRDADDIPAMMAAIADQNNWPKTVSTSANPIIPAIVGDYDGNGSFDANDIRFFADGLAINPATGTLDRELGFTAVDTAFGGNYFGTTWAGGAPYVYGDARFDVAGSAAAPTPGAEPTGSNDIIDGDDLAYVEANFGDFTDIDQALYMDLSCDMNGDLVVDAIDANLIRAGLGEVLIGDSNCDGSIDTRDIDAFVAALTGGEAAWLAEIGGTACGDFLAINDINRDGEVNTRDIDAFVAVVTN